MRTNEFIEKLDAGAGDVCYVRWDGAPVSVEISKEGPFMYIDENDKFHFTMDGYRVLVKSITADDLLHRLGDWYDGSTFVEDRERLWEQYQTYLVFEMQGSSKYYLDGIRKRFDEWVDKMASQ